MEGASREDFGRPGTSHAKMCGFQDGFAVDKWQLHYHCQRGAAWLSGDAVPQIPIPGAEGGDTAAEPRAAPQQLVHVY